MEFDDVRALLARLDGETADQIESQTVEFKSWNPQPRSTRDQIRAIREGVVAFANASGGTLILGVSDRKRTRAEAIHGVGDLNLDRLRIDIHDGTLPHILVYPEVFDEPEGRVVALRVLPGIPPHTTSEGIGKIRVGNVSKPITGHDFAQIISGRGLFDLSAEAVPDVAPSDLLSREIERLRNVVALNGGQRDLLALDDAELLTALGLASSRGLSLAAVLLLGNPAAIHRAAPAHEVIMLRMSGGAQYDLRKDSRSPILALLEEFDQWLQPNLAVTTIHDGFYHREIPIVSNLTAREALLNAIVHRDYVISSSIQIELHEDRLVFTSPGGFVRGITANNLLRHAPERRNPLLAEVLQKIGLVNRAGLGVDRIIEDHLSLGKQMPRYRDTGLSIELTLPTRTDEAFARFVTSVIRSGAQLNLNELMAMRGVANEGALNRNTAATLLQLPQADAADTLVSLRERGMLSARGRGVHTLYGLATDYQYLMSKAARDQTVGPLDHEAASSLVLGELRSRGKLANADVRFLTGYSRARARRLMNDLCIAGLANPRGRGRGSHYVPIPPEREPADAENAPNNARDPFL